MFDNYCRVHSRGVNYAYYHWVVNISTMLAMIEGIVKSTFADVYTLGLRDNRR